MKRLKAIMIFQRKVFFPALLLSLLLVLPVGMREGNIPFLLLIAYTMIASLVHYFNYEVANRRDYNLYFNLGLSRRILWLSTILTGVILSILSVICITFM